MSLSPLVTLVLPLLACRSALTSEVASDGVALRTSPRNVAILVYEGVELLDFAGPGEVFSAAQGATGSAFHVYTVAKSRTPLTSQGFVKLTPEFSIADCPRPDLIVIPGGAVPADDAELQAWVRNASPSCEVVLSVCNGALLLAGAGLLDGLEATTHHGSLEALAMLAPDTRVFTNRRFVDNGHVMTSAGVSAGIDGALHVVERLLGEQEARNTARYMEYEWRPAEIAALHAQPGRRVEQGPGPHLATVARERGVAAALVELRALSPQPSEPQLNRAGHLLLMRGEGAEARALLELVVAAHPDSANARDSLSEACERQGDAKAAIQHAEEALARLAVQTGLDPALATAIANVCHSRLVRLGPGDKSTLRFACKPCGASCDEQRYLAAGSCPCCNMALVEVSATTAVKE